MRQTDNFGIKLPESTDTLLKSVEYFQDSFILIDSLFNGYSVPLAWTNLTMTISAATHGHGKNPIVDIQYKDGSVYKKDWAHYTSADWTIQIDSEGNVIITTTAVFEGRVIIK